VDLDLETQLATIVAVTSLLAAVGGFAYDILFPVGVASDEATRIDNRISLPHRVEGGIDLGFLGPVLVGVVAANAAVFAVAFRTEEDGSAQVAISTLIWIALVAGVAGAAVLDALRDRLIARIQGGKDKQDSKGGLAALLAPAITEELESRFPQLTQEICEGTRSVEDAAAELESRLLGVVTAGSSQNGSKAKRPILRYAAAILLLTILLIAVATAQAPGGGKRGSGSLVALTLRTEGSGLVRIGAGITCPPTCSYDAKKGDKVRLTAVASEGFGFAGWSGGCSDRRRCVIEIDEETSLTATFRKLRQEEIVSLSLSVQGKGVISIAPGVQCPPACSYDTRQGAGLVLSAAPAEGFGFSGWTGACGGTGDCDLSMEQDSSVTAIFEEQEVPSVQLTILISRGEGSVQISPIEATCPPTCSLEVAQNQELNLTAIPAEGFYFNEWFGSCGGTGACTLPMAQDTNVDATFINVEG